MMIVIQIISSGNLPRRGSEACGGHRIARSHVRRGRRYDASEGDPARGGTVAEPTQTGKRVRLEQLEAQRTGEKKTKPIVYPISPP